MLTHLQASAHWDHVLLVSDLHLSADDPATADVWHRFLQDNTADAIFVLGDYFDLWVGDDLLQAQNLPEPFEQAVAFWQTCANHLRQGTQRQPIYWMVGNRDFLVGPSFAQSTGVQRICDPCVIHWGEHRWLLSHGDQWCTDDADYQGFRRMVRSTAWQQDFLSQTLMERLRQGQAMRAQSQAHQSQMSHYTDVNLAAVLAAVQETGATGVIHGHTHQGQTFALGSGERHALSDWDAHASPPRLQALQLNAQGCRVLKL